MRLHTAIIFVSTLLAIAGCNAKDAEKANTQAPTDAANSSQTEEFNTLDQKLSYLFGYDIGRRIKEDNITVDIKIFETALQDAKEARQPRIAQDVIQATMKEFQQKQRTRLAAAQKSKAESNRKASEAFFNENAKKENIVVTNSGLQYKIIQAGTGVQPSQKDKVTVHYRGTLLDGSEFDSSYKRGEPVTFPVGGVISGWTEALQLMKEGAKWELYIPAKLAYGPGGTGDKIGPEAALIFEVELIKVINDSKAS